MELQSCVDTALNHNQFTVLLLSINSKLIILLWAEWEPTGEPQELLQNGSIACWIIFSIPHTEKETQVFPSWSQGRQSLLISLEQCFGLLLLIHKNTYNILIDSLALECILKEILLLFHKHRAPLNCQQNTSPENYRSNRRKNIKHCHNKIFRRCYTAPLWSSQPLQGSNSFAIFFHWYR